jgi:hypothetical protein
MSLRAPAIVAAIVALALGTGIVLSLAGARTPAACATDVRRGVLPAWARTGFSAERPRLPHVIGRRGLLAALLFGDPLSAPPAADRANKILWVSRPLPGRTGDLRLTAQRREGEHGVGPVISRVVAGGPGPSIVDVPGPGCWRFQAAWPGHRDTLDLDYRPAAGGR